MCQKKDWLYRHLCGNNLRNSLHRMRTKFQICIGSYQDRFRLIKEYSEVSWDRCPVFPFNLREDFSASLRFYINNWFLAIHSIFPLIFVPYRSTP
jgi:hypothetical protein